MDEALRYLLLPDVYSLAASCMGMLVAWLTIRREKRLPPYKRNGLLGCVLISNKSTASK